jgi:hypothetical protein
MSWVRPARGPARVLRAGRGGRNPAPERSSGGSRRRTIPDPSGRLQCKAPEGRAFGGAGRAAVRVVAGDRGSGGRGRGVGGAAIGADVLDRGGDPLAAIEPAATQGRAGAGPGGRAAGAVFRTLRHHGGIFVGALGAAGRAAAAPAGRGGAGAPQVAGRSGPAPCAPSSARRTGLGWGQEPPAHAEGDLDALRRSPRSQRPPPLPGIGALARCRIRQRPWARAAAAPSPHRPGPGPRRPAGGSLAVACPPGKVAAGPTRAGRALGAPGRASRPGRTASHRLRRH